MTNSIYVAEYLYEDDINELKAEFRGAHRQFMRQLNSEGHIFSTGRIDAFNSSGSLTIVLAPSGQAVRDLLSEDPYIKGGLVKEVLVRSWTPVVGTFVEDEK